MERLVASSNRSGECGIISGSRAGWLTALYLPSMTPGNSLVRAVGSSSQSMRRIQLGPSNSSMQDDGSSLSIRRCAGGIEYRDSLFRRIHSVTKIRESVKGLLKVSFRLQPWHGLAKRGSGDFAMWAAAVKGYRGRYLIDTSHARRRRYRAIGSFRYTGSR